MTDVLAAPVPVDSGEPVLLGLPVLDDRVIARARLEREFRAAEGSVLTVVQAPMGSGKTLGVAGWAVGHRAVTGVLWLDAGRLDAGRGADDRELFWSRVRSGLTDLGIGRIEPVPGTIAKASWVALDLRLGRRARRRRRSLAARVGRFPERTRRGARRTARCPSRPDHTLRVVITCTGTPALDLARVRAGVRYAHIGVGSLQMDEHEVAEVLTRSGVTTDRATIAAVPLTPTGGRSEWALSVGRWWCRPVVTKPRMSSVVCSTK